MIPALKTQSPALICLAQLHKITRINNLVNTINILFGKLKFFHQKLLDFWTRSITGHLNREGRFSLNQNIFHCVNKVFTSIFINGKVCITGNLKKQCLFNIKTWEKFCSKGRNYILQKRKLTSMNTTGSISRKPVNIWKALRNFYKSNTRRIFITTEFLATLSHLNSLNWRKQKSRIGGKIFYMRKSFCISSKRSKQRKDFRTENSIKIFRLLLRVLKRSNINKPFNCKLRKNICHKTFLLSTNYLMSTSRN